MRRLSLKTGLSVKECVERLEKAIVKEGFLHPFASVGSDGVSGRIKGNEFRLQKRRISRNSFAPVCWGKLIQTGAGTAVKCCFDIRLFARVFMFFWFGGLLLMGIFAFILDSERSLPAAAIIPFAVMGMFGVALVWFCKWLARNEQGYLTGFLMATLAAEEDMSKPLGF